jgi:two-component system, NtrC family, sensor kinase
MNHAHAIPTTYDYRLVVLSFVIAILTSYTALDLAGRVTANRGFARVAWLLGGAFAMGSGIWCMHYTGMLACRLPIPVYYHVPTVGLSLLAAILASLVALYAVSRERMTLWHVAMGSLLMGSGIAAMHYTGMAAMRLAAMHSYNRGLCALSVFLAIAISFVGLLLMSYSREENRGWRLKSAIALCMGLAIPVMHYTGMAAVSFIPTDVEPDLSYPTDMSAPVTFTMMILTGLILSCAWVTCLVERRFSAQHSLLERERTILRALIDNIPDFMYVKDARSRFVVANAHLAQLVGAKTSEELHGKSDFDLFPQEIARSSYEDDQEVMRSGRSLFNREERTSDSAGNEIYTLTTKVPLRDGRGDVTGIAGVGRDISEQKKSDDALRKAEGKYRGIFDEAIFGIFQISLEGRYLSVNPAMARTLGYASPEELISNGPETCWELIVDPKRLADFLSIMGKDGSAQNFECEIYRKDRSRIWISSSVRTIYEEGKAIRHEGMSEDVTERQLLRGQLLQAQKLESVGQLAAGIAHEINTPTQFIEHNVHFLKDAFQDLSSLLGQYDRLLTAARAGRLSSGTVDEVAAAVERADTGFLIEEIPRAFEQTLEGVTRVSSLVGAMKEFSHPGTKEKVPLDLNHAIQSTITVARHEWKYVADIETLFDPSLPLVSCQPGEFNQVILILIVNAAQAIAEACAKEGAAMGKITVRTQKLEEWVEIRIQDTGTGIPERVRSRIFDPFFTTKEIGKGTGQGLAIARSVIVDKHGGSIAFETEEGQGTTFILRLPQNCAIPLERAAVA